MAEIIEIRDGTVYDPANQQDGVVRSIWIQDGRIVEHPSDPVICPRRVIDARGLVVMPGGIDIHAHVAGPKVNFARKMRPEEKRTTGHFPRSPLLRSGTRGSVPSTFVTGYLYAGMGYTTVFDAAIPPIAARHAHEEFHDTPIIDKGFLVLIGNHLFALDQIRQADLASLRDFTAWLLTSTRGYGLKVVNPGGVEAWKHGGSNDTGLDSKIPPFDISPRDILRSLAYTCDDLGLPHPLHIHCNRLGIPGNWRTTLASMEALEGSRGHFTHIQFHSYGGDLFEQETFSSAVPNLAEYVNKHPNLTVDVGQVLFGDTTSMTGDSPLGYYLHKVTGGKWFNSDTELEAGCGIVPIVYKDRSFVHALQWAIGLEWYLLVEDPWRIAMSTDHPNGAAFIAYPEIIHLLMSRDYRREVIQRLPTKVRERTVLADLEREYTLNEIAIITRAAPARMLGLPQKGRLNVGADADITIYSPSPDIGKMFSIPRYVIKGGDVIVDDGEIRKVVYGPTFTCSPSYDPMIEKSIAQWFNSYSTISAENFPVGDEYLPHGWKNIECGSPG